MASCSTYVPGARAMPVPSPEEPATSSATAMPAGIGTSEHASSAPSATLPNLPIRSPSLASACQTQDRGDPEAVNSYRGAYLPSYSWAEFSTGPFRSRLR